MRAIPLNCYSHSGSAYNRRSSMLSDGYLLKLTHGFNVMRAELDLLCLKHRATCRRRCCKVHWRTKRLYNWAFGNSIKAGHHQSLYMLYLTRLQTRIPDKQKRIELCNENKLQMLTFWASASFSAKNSSEIASVARIACNPRSCHADDMLNSWQC